MNDQNGTKLSTLKSLIRDLGFPIVVAGYFLAKDWFFTEKLIQLQTRIAIVLDELAGKLH